MYDCRNRIYDPQLGRFLQTDPKGFDAGDMNLFRYCADDPVDRTDPTGLEDPVRSGTQPAPGVGPLQEQTNPIGEFIRMQNGYKPDASTIERHAIKATNSAEDRTWSDAYRREMSGYAIGVYVGPHGDVVDGPAVKSEVLKGSNQINYKESTRARCVSAAAAATQVV